jgi:serine phosphatase RsbU (regulator of sigma subunit)
LNGIISRGIAESNQILDALDLEVRTALQQEKSGNNDGMDVALCIYRKEKNLIEFSGAKNSLVYIQENTINVIRGDVRSIGGNQKGGYTFKKHLIAIDKTTMLYLFSDGYRDQFGGSDNSKFMSKRFHKLLQDIHKEPMETQKSILDKEIIDWMGSQPQTDDILVMGLRIEPGNIA